MVKQGVKISNGFSIHFIIAFLFCMVAHAILNASYRYPSLASACCQSPAGVCHAFTMRAFALLLLLISAVSISYCSQPNDHFTVPVYTITLEEQRKASLKRSHSTSNGDSNSYTEEHHAVARPNMNGFWPNHTLPTQQVFNSNTSTLTPISVLQNVNSIGTLASQPQLLTHRQHPFLNAPFNENGTTLFDSSQSKSNGYITYHHPESTSLNSTPTDTPLDRSGMTGCTQAPQHGDSNKIHGLQTSQNTIDNCMLYNKSQRNQNGIKHGSETNMPAASTKMDESYNGHYATIDINKVNPKLCIHVPVTSTYQNVESTNGTLAPPFQAIAESILGLDIPDAIVPQWTWNQINDQLSGIVITSSQPYSAPLRPVVQQPQTPISKHITDKYGYLLNADLPNHYHIILEECKMGFKDTLVNSVFKFSVFDLIYSIAILEGDEFLKHELQTLPQEDIQIVLMALVFHNAFELVRMLGLEEDNEDLLFFEPGNEIITSHTDADLRNLSLTLKAAQDRFPEFFDFAAERLPTEILLKMLDSLLKHDLSALAQTPGLPVHVDFVHECFYIYDRQPFSILVNLYFVRCPNIGQILIDLHQSDHFNALVTILASTNFSPQLLSKLPHWSDSIDLVFAWYAMYVNEEFNLAATKNAAEYIMQTNYNYTPTEVLRMMSWSLCPHRVMGYVEMIAQIASPSIMLDSTMMERLGATPILASIIALFRNAMVGLDGKVHIMRTDQSEAVASDAQMAGVGSVQQEVNFKCIQLHNLEFGIVRYALMITQQHGANVEQALNMVCREHGLNARENVEKLLQLNVFRPLLVRKTNRKMETASVHHPGDN